MMSAKYIVKSFDSQYSSACGSLSVRFFIDPSTRNRAGQGGSGREHPIPSDAATLGILLIWLLMVFYSVSCALLFWLSQQLGNSELSRILKH